MDLRGVGDKVNVQENESILLTRGIDDPTKYSDLTITVLENQEFEVTEKYVIHC